MFFSFDGIDGVGKSTQMERFCSWLREQGRDVLICRDPGTTPLGETLRELLLNPSGPAIGCRAEMLIYMAARAQLIDEVIRPALARGQVVVSDRYLLANVAYQAYGGGLDPKAVWDVGRTAVDGLMPDLVLLLDLDVATACTRRGRAADRIESQGIEYLERVRQGFLCEARKQPQQVVVIDAAQATDDVQQSIRQAARPWVERSIGN